LQLPKEVNLNFYEVVESKFYQVDKFEK